ncbi:MAG TPA: hypothetical protein VLV88_02220 [Terriglobales bacterium]|nr:hypothetical protein [Terriglobales bacterium]
MSIPVHVDREGQPSIAPRSSPEELEVAPGRTKESVEGWIPDLATEDVLRAALEKAFDYRGDVTLTLKNGTTIEGYIFDRVSGTSLENSFVRVLQKDSAGRLKISYADIAALAFTGRDTAAGKSWEAWVKKYWEKKATGGPDPSLQPEALE